MTKLIVLNSDGSIADIFSIPDTLAIELTTVLQYSNRKYLDLALLREIELQVLSVISKGFAISTIYCFSSLLDVISRIEKLPNADSLTIRLSK